VSGSRSARTSNHAGDQAEQCPGFGLPSLAAFRRLSKKGRDGFLYHLGDRDIAAVRLRVDRFQRFGP
jgi:hypothetical protein